MTSKAKRLFAGSALGIVNFFAVTFVSLYMMPFLIRHLGDRMYGLWLLVGSVLGFYGLLDLGIGTATQRYFSRAVGTGDENEAKIIVNSSLYIFSFVGLAAVVVSVLLAFFGHVFFSDPTEADLFRKIVILAGISLGLSFPMKAIWAIFAGNLRYDLTIYVDLIK